MELIFEKSRPGRRAVVFDPLDVPEATLPPALCREEPAALPEVGELDVVRHFSRLSQRNFGIDTHFYPLGSCTMKYLSLIHISEPTRLLSISYAVFCLKKKKPPH